MDEHPLRGLLIIAVLIVISALVTAAETIVKNINEGNLKKRVDEGEIKSKKVLRIINAKAMYSNAADLLLISIHLIIGILFSFSQYNIIWEFICNRITKTENSIINTFLMIVVITSYSIHYTKLYEDSNDQMNAD